MKSLSALEIHYLVKELQFLINSRVDKIYVPRKKEIIIQLFVSGKGKHHLKIDEKSIYLTDYKSASESPSDFTMFLRKKIGNARLRKIRQLGFERILALDFETKSGTFSLITELFSRGNILLLKNNKILIAAEYQNWKDRVIRPKVEYKHPEKEYDFFKLTQTQLKKLLSITNKENIVKSLAIELGLGGVYAEEACLIAGIDKDKKAKDLTESEIKLLSIAFEKLKTKKINPQIIYKNKDIFDLVPFKLNLYSTNKQQPAKTYSEILNSYFSEEALIKQKEKHQNKIDQIMNIINKQKQDIKNLEKQEKESMQKGEKLYIHYQLASEVLKELKEISKKHPWKEIQNKLKSHKLIKEVIPKEKSIVLEI